MGTIIILSSSSLWLSLHSSKKIYFYLSVLFTLVVLVSQYSLNTNKPISYLDEGGKLKQVERMKGYPPVYLIVAGKTIWIPAANWLENRPETVSIYNIQNNLGEVLDPNLYFFANHPRERFQVIEFEKFPYIFLPVFILGVLLIKKVHTKSVLLALSPLVLLSFIGDNNAIGPFSLFPFFTMTIALGVQFILIKKKYLIPSLVALLLVFIQTVAYATY